ncbi:MULTISPECIES: hypothetical protein [Fructobacillus]|uniref:Uncharacterized protein n=1 Tax=Fructobacillus durionis TaxID=283737 RepID=A0A1I1ECS3_9LACO|nr:MULTISPECIES: hypothetical protein [Fructobacillus]MDD9138795.1 hypothetical protein [Fructobacillus sp. CRL 2054]SFB84847.1 hypothetical protein SAMN05660453_0419 [Fructobacillus durionis]
MNLPINSNTDYLRHNLEMKRVKFSAFFLRFRDNILNNRDKRVALEEGRHYEEQHHQASDLLTKRVIAANDRYDYGARASRRH